MLLELLFTLFLSLSIGFLLSFLFVNKAEVGGWYYIYHGLGALVLALLGSLLGKPPTQFLSTPPLLINAILSTLLLGFSMAAMILGHWYLIRPKMAIGELKRTCVILIGLIVARFFFGIYGTLGAMEKVTASLFPFLLMRFAWGLLAPLALSYFIWGTVKIRSTQSATGILYVAVLCILTGEILSHYLALVHGIAM